MAQLDLKMVFAVRIHVDIVGVKCNGKRNVAVLFASLVVYSVTPSSATLVEVSVE